MKLRKSLLVCVMALTLIFVTACGGIHLSEMPKTSDTVYGNGGFSVTKGDFVYFVNSYTSYNGLGKNDNNNGEVKNSAIYRTKLKDGKVEYDEKGNVKNCELVVSKIAGYEFTNLHIYDDYIYYATPNMEYQKDGNLKTSAIDFCRTKLDGSKTDVIYTARDYDDNSKYQTYKIGESVYLVVFEKDKIVKVEISNRVKASIELVKNVSAVLMPKNETYVHATNTGISGTEGYVYYVRNFNEEQDNAYDTSTITGNILGRVCISDGKIEERKDISVKFELKDLNNDYIFVAKGTDIFAIDKSFPLSSNSDVRITYSTDSLNISNFYATKNTDGYVYVKDSKTYFVKNVKNPKTYLISNSSLEIKNDDIDFAYFVEDNKIKRISLYPKYMNSKKFNLEADAKINGINKKGKVNDIEGDLIPAFTTISAEEYSLITNAVDKGNFELTLSSELIFDDPNIDTTYFDFTNDGEIYYFSKYTSENGETTRPYLKRVVISLDNKFVEKDDETGEAIEPEKYEDFNQGYNVEVMCMIEEGFSSKSSS